MRSNRGFTIIEFMIVLVIAGFLWLTVSGICRNSTTSSDTVCRAGYLFDWHSGRQLINEKGGGIPCDGQNNGIQSTK